MKTSLRSGLFGILCFLYPFVIYFVTQSSSLMFDDAAEFATVIRLGSIAHPPGFPAFILIGMGWDFLLSFFSDHFVFNLNLLSIFLSSVAAFLFYKTILAILTQNESKNNTLKNEMAAAASVLSFAAGVTTWTWSNTVEVYAFQLVAMSLLLYGLVKHHFTKKSAFLLVASLGYGLALSNHHLTIILFTPFIPFFFMPQFFTSTVQYPFKADKKKRENKETESFLKAYFNALKLASLWKMASVAILVMVGCYLWMFWRAQQDYPFMFGQPDSLSKILYHMTGGSYSKNLETTSQTIFLSRIPYFLQLTFFQFLFFFPLLLLGFARMIRIKLIKLVWMIVAYFMFLFIYQINNNQWENTDAYMLLPFLVLSIGVAFGVSGWYDQLKLKFVLPILILLQTAYNFNKCDRREYNISESLMHLLDVSSPPNSIIIVADWSLVMQYYYSRIVENFRPDLIVLNQDIKFNHYKVIRVLYPEFYKSIQIEYDRFIDELSKEHPEQITNTGCDLTTIDLMSRFHSLISKIESVAILQNRPLLTDPRANYFFVQQGLYAPKRFVSGCFVSSVPSDRNEEFLHFDMKWLKSPMLAKDLTALNKMVDFQAMFDSHLDYYTSVNDTIRYGEAVAGKEKVMRIQREMKKHISFAYKIK